MLEVAGPEERGPLHQGDPGGAVEAAGHWVGTMCKKEESKNYF